MKNLRILSLSLLLLLVLPLIAQQPKAQRLVLLEEFTSSTCGPCASVNPTIVQRLQQNPDKFTAIFYHVSWPSPGNDPMYLANTQENNARVNYYGVNSVPYSVIDGNYYTGHPNGWTMTTINNRYAMPSPAEIQLQHYLNAAQDSIFVNMLVILTDMMTGSQLVAQNVIIEKHIHFNTAPGTNGEKDFYNVMKKMLPGAGGTNLPTPLSPGDYVIMQYSWKLANVYDNNELAAIGFIQNNSSKEVLQTSNSSPAPLTPLYSNDGEILSLSNVAPENCTGKVAPVIRVRNNGSNSLSSITLKYRIDNQPEQEYTWTGNIGFLQSKNIALPEYLFAPQNSNTLKIYIDKVNQLQDEYRKNDTLTFHLSEPKTATTVLNIWIKTDNKPEEITWSIKTSDGSLVSSGGPYAQASTLIKETIKVESEHCYQFALYDAGGNGLCCANGLGFFTLFDDKNVTIAEGTTFGSEVLAQFYSQSGIGIEDLSKQYLSIIPNPVSHLSMIYFNMNTDGKVNLNIYNLNGSLIFQKVSETLNKGEQKMKLNVERMNSGIYLIEIIMPDKKVLRQRFVVQ
ncbi:MAG TPA: T9SS type A sorting domain-containing protein [Bacteroidales bacterium]|jgi:thiol-disulfide isomerase/thioredoxin|nr:T9SS type A sorting domain-containing protein [Bacteroidales bacterium]MDI9574029.1 T9SS type A sorting domain-containing protein [Bacteroidota bacterium]MBP9512523.1 T9SS type A sorting domain-containing protein [Bacteroidales bacterium]MBP9589051.1 T9SS type A sorting domain-containing protein [Bacteroidales bacterium]HOE59761.1 T9SS type A sorting domain-containing protein [Bacteroidales bacterium]